MTLLLRPGKTPIVSSPGTARIISILPMDLLSRQGSIEFLLEIASQSALCLLGTLAQQVGCITIYQTTSGYCAKYRFKIAIIELQISYNLQICKYIIYINTQTFKYYKLQYNWYMQIFYFILIFHPKRNCLYIIYFFIIAIEFDIKNLLSGYFISNILNFKFFLFINSSWVKEEERGRLEFCFHEGNIVFRSRFVGQPQKIKNASIKQTQKKNLVIKINYFIH